MKETHEPAGAAPHRVTLDDVAQAAGVSRATVSRVVNGSHPVRADLAKAVRVAIDDLGYVPNLVARSLMTRRTDMVALVAGEPDVRVFADPYFAGIVRGISEVLADADLRLVLSMLHRSTDVGLVESYLLGGHVDGVLVISEHAALSIVERLAASGIPVVLGGRPSGTVAGLPYVDLDNASGARMAAQHLLQRGCRRIATIAGPRDMSAGIDRLAGFRDGLGAQFSPQLVARGDFTVAGGVAAAEQLLATDPAIDGIFAASDLMALGAQQVMRREGRRVPDDVALVGFDDIDLGRTANPPLTTIRQDPVLQGRMMVQLLLQVLGRSEDLPKASRHALAGKTSVVLPVQLIVRASA